MPTVGIPEFSMPKDLKDVRNQLIEVQGYLEWLLKHLDHLNVKYLHTEHCKIRSEAGETQIDGPRLLMYDRQNPPVLRLRQGYDELTGDFLFQLYNGQGGLTLELDSNGDILHRGTYRSGLTTEARIEITGAGLRGITSDGLLNGLVFNPPAGTDIADVFLYHRGAKLVEFYDDITGYVIRGASGASFFGLGGNCPTHCYGSWDFGTTSSVSGLVTGTESSHDHGGTTGSGGADGHVHGINDDGQHYHNVTRG